MNKDNQKIEIWATEMPSYSLIDSGNKCKLEEIGGIRIARSEPRAWWNTTKNEKDWKDSESMMKNRWVKLINKDIVCYGQIQDAGPYEYDDFKYVFGDGSIKPKNKLANEAGMDVSPALRDCLQFVGENNAENRIDWQFIDFAGVPEGPWREIITASQINWP